MIITEVHRSKTPVTPGTTYGLNGKNSKTHRHSTPCNSSRWNERGSCSYTYRYPMCGHLRLGKIGGLLYSSIWLSILERFVAASERCISVALCGWVLWHLLSFLGVVLNTIAVIHGIKCDHDRGEAGSRRRKAQEAVDGTLEDPWKGRRPPQLQREQYYSVTVVSSNLFGRPKTKI